MSKYLLLMNRPPDLYTAMSPDEIQKAVVKYVTWRNRLIEDGVYAGSEKLADKPGKIVRRDQGQTRVTDGPYSEAKEVLGGFFIINVASYEDAVKQAEDCPNLEYGGSVEVRLVDEARPRQ